MGRRRKSRRPKTISIGVRLNKEDYRKLQELVREEGFSHASELIRFLIREEYDMWQISRRIGEDLTVRAWKRLVWDEIKRREDR